MGNTRPRHNAKGRATAQNRGAKRPAPPSSNATAESWQEGLDVIVPCGKTEDEEEKHRQRMELLANSDNYDPEEKMSKKKKRRLDAFIERKLKKERRGGLLKSLERSQATLSDRLALISTASLTSTSIATTQRRQAERQSAIEQRRRERAQHILSQRKGASGYHSEDDSNDHMEDEEPPAVSTAAKEKEKGFVADTAFSGALAVEHVKRLPRPLPPPQQDQPRIREPVTAPCSNPIGSALAAGVKAVVVQRPRKKRRALSIPSGSDSDFHSHDSVQYLSSESGELAGDEERGAKGTFEADAEAGQEWQGIGSDNGEEWGGIAETEESRMNESRVGPEEGDGGVSADSVASRPRVKGSFRDWANARVREAGGAANDTAPQLGPTTETNFSITKEHAPAAAGEKVGPLGAPLDLTSTPLLRQRTVHVSLTRPASVQASRSLLPVVAEEGPIMDAIRRHPVVIICGETGSGKTTQVPQFLFEAGWGDADSDNPGMIGITQPRRVAAVSMARRVEEEMGLKDQGIVGHQIRYDATTGPRTKVKFMTDGVLLREVATDFALTKYSAIIVDESHERSVNTDVLIGLLSRIVKLRLKLWTEGEEGARPLRLVIMSATLRVADFSENKILFANPPPVLNVSARQYPVVSHFNRRTAPDYVAEAYKKVCKIHSRLPPGGVLVFLTGQQEITLLCKKLEQRFGRRAVEQRQKQAGGMASFAPSRAKHQRPREVLGEEDSGAGRPLSVNAMVADVEAEDLDLGTGRNLTDNFDERQTEEDPEALDTDEEEDLIIEGVEIEDDSQVPMHVLPLYSLLPTEQQMRVFIPPPPDARLIVVATNVAETSLTIPNIKYVVDSGRTKERRCDLSTGVQHFEVTWISKASAAQRSGRAGRTGPGHCYRLYSSAVYENHFPQHSEPEILRMPIEGIVLQMKAMNIDKVVNFPFPTPPDRRSLQKAETGLTHLGALAPSSVNPQLAQITDIGRSMSYYPLSPRLARMLVSGNQHGCLPYVIALVSILSVGDPFLREDVIGGDETEDALTDADKLELDLLHNDDVREREARKLQRRAYFQVQTRYAGLGGRSSDIFKALAVVGAYEAGGGSAAFCRENFVRPKAMEEIRKLRAQISHIVHSNTGVDPGFSPDLQPPSDSQCVALRQMLTSAYVDQVAVRKDLVDKSSAVVKHSVRSKDVAYRVIGLEEDVFMHSSSILFDSSPPEFMLYQELHRTSRVWLKGLTRINSAWLSTLAKPLCTYSKPLDDYQGKGRTSLAKATETQRECFVIPRFGGPTLDVALPAIKALQRRVGARWVWV